MKISIITLFPKMISGFFEESIVKRAIEKGLVEIEIVDLRGFAVDKRGSVDDRPYGGGAGMVLRADIIYAALNKLKIKSEKLKVNTVLTSAKGNVFNQEKAKQFSKFDHLIIIAGHYEGVDERVLDYIDEEISLGDFVMTGGEISASAMVDSVVRLIPGVLKKEEAPEIESFFNVDVDELIKVIGENEILTKLKKRDVKEVQLLEFPQYTRPEEFEGKKIPTVLLSGNHAEIERWRLKKAYEETIKKRLDLLS
jgi:tRNA (guanine37-N1)-methyltransferase